jgi:glycosyltransferase involved in cell wall biosynthesis
MRILMIAPEPFFQPRGTPISVFYRLQALAKLNLEVDLLTYHLGEDVHIEGVRIFRIPRIPLIRRVKVGPSSIKPFLDLLLWLKAWAMLSTGRYDVLHAHEEAAYFSVPLAAMFGMKLLYDMHSSLPQQLANYQFGNHRPVVRLFSQAEKFVLRRAHAVITICPDLERHVEGLAGRDKQFLIENYAVGQPPDSQDRRAAELRERLDLNGKLVVVYTGTFERNQGLELLVQGASGVLAEFPQVVYLLVGGRPDQLEKLRGLAAKQGVGQQFLFPGPQPLTEVPFFLEIADVLVSPRFQGTNTPLKIYSYLASGKPIVATNMETHRQVLDDQTAVLVPPTAEGIAQGIRMLLRDESLRVRLSQSSRQLVEEKYSYASYLAKTQRVFDYLKAL